MTDFERILTEAQDKRTFSVLEVAQGRGYPQDIETIYMDAESGYQAQRLSALLNDESDNDERERLAEEIRELWAKVQESQLTFHLRGISPGAVKSINDEAGGKFEDTIEGPGAQWCNFKYIAESIVKVVDYKGAVDNHHWTVEDIEAFKGLAPAESFDKIALKTDELTFTAAFFDSTVTSDFS